MKLIKPPTYDASRLFEKFINSTVTCPTCDAGYQVQKEDERVTTCYLSVSSDGHFNGVLKWTCPNCRNDNYTSMPATV